MDMLWENLSLLFNFIRIVCQLPQDQCLESKNAVYYFFLSSMLLAEQGADRIFANIFAELNVCLYSYSL